jgi:hypothetical protein
MASFAAAWARSAEDAVADALDLRMGLAGQRRDLDVLGPLVGQGLLAHLAEVGHVDGEGLVGGLDVAPVPDGAARAPASTCARAPTRRR